MHEMMMFLVVLLCIAAAQVMSLSAPRVNVSKLKTDQSKMKSQLTRHNTREQALASKEALLPKFGGQKGDKDVREDNGFTFFELLVRRAGTGPWLRYLDLDGDVVTETMVTNVINGGVENELWRGKLDEFVRSSLFGIGIGGETVAISKVKTALPQLKKVRSREIQFGYRIALDDETVYSVDFIHSSSAIDKAIEKKALRGLPPRIDVIALMQQHHSRDKDTDNDPTVELLRPMDNDLTKPDAQVSSAVSSASESCYESSEAAVRSLLHTLAASMTAAEATSCVLFSDGSATIYDMGGHVQGLAQGPEPGHSSGQVAIDGSTATPAPAPASTPIPLNVDNKAVISFSSASCGVYILPMRNLQPLYDISVCLRVHSVAGMVDSPFDAELIAGLSAITLVHMMLAQMEASDDNNADTKNSNAESSPIHSPTPSPGLREVTLHTDSKTLTRAVRTGPQGDLAHRASPTRLALWRLLHDHIQHLTNTGSGDGPEEGQEQGLVQGQGLGPVTGGAKCSSVESFECQWVPGHPERRDSDKSRWTYKDIGIWVADEVAKESEEQEVVLTGCVLTRSPDNRVDEKLRASTSSTSSPSSSQSISPSPTKETKKKITAAVAAARDEKQGLEQDLEHLRSSEAGAAATAGSGTAPAAGGDDEGERVRDDANGLAQGQGPALGLSSGDGVRTAGAAGDGVDGEGLPVGQQKGASTEGDHLVTTETEIEQQLRQQRLQYQQYQQKKQQQKQQQLLLQQITPPPSQQMPQSDLTPQIEIDSASVKIPVVTIRGDALVRMSSALRMHQPRVKSSLK